jgi:putative two-component system response regulator
MDIKKKKLILAVDDSLPNLKQISALLTGYYEISLAKSGLMALHICEQVMPDLILLDIEMPEMDGFETIGRLKQDPRLCKIPVIFLTGDHDPETEVRGLQLGAMDFITKPAVKAILLHRIELHLCIAAYQAQMENTVLTMSESIATSLAELIEFRDKDTGEHVVRTSKYVDCLGRELLKNGLFVEELTGPELQMMIRAAPLHDIGKIAISDRILLKPGKLSDEEFAVMKSHTEVGAKIVERMYQRTPNQSYLQCARLITAYHHERFDGKGYPQGLEGDDIPLCARIMAVADVYDALTSNRIYHTAMSHAEACRMIIDGSGTSFDPRIVSAFRTVQEEFEKAPLQDISIPEMPWRINVLN